MAQLHCYVPDEVARKLRQKADNAHLSVSKYLAQLVKREIGDEWPKDYFDIFGSWEVKSLERPEQGDFEKREDFK